ncbi:cytochrome c oxidase accessory protein CcoG [Oceaniglobus ichthyenteri]|uniref:cytochrome c oxidase accessory protein CcoG n=1 Tax=Oceaniglobus ichthyenteri TaxID=2136177 RepID=UPI000D357EFC|nr:cytochrome c oxidase accessory protein CcoG [Oceaniglobus ichthyenteri]
MATDTPPSLYAAREPIFPRRVNGFFRKFKWWIMIVTLGIYYLTPWIRWDRGPALPDQAVLVDLAGRRFYFFWIEIWPHEFYFVAGLLIMAGLGLFLFTSALGRVWCGYTCPQTVWTDLFILVERWIEGDRNARIRLHRAKWDARKWMLRLSKWSVWLVIAVATGGAWVFYFADAPTLAKDLFTFGAPGVAYATIAILTATTFVFGGFMREQVCIYMCPWPRIQGAMMDEGTLTVGYRDWRGEPRGKHRKGARAAAATRTATAYGTPESDLPPEPEAQVGDCIDCMACVNVCPMGIDIRDGQQMECITCALCIDACDDIMAKIGKPRGLIDYLALDDVPPTARGDLAAVRPLGTDSTDDRSVTVPVEGRIPDAPYAGAAPVITTGVGDWKPKPVWKHILRPRTIIYTFLWTLIGIGLVWALFVRSDIGLTVEPVRNPTYVTLSDGAVRNAYTLRLRNMTGQDREFRLLLTSDDTFAITLEGEGDADTVIVPAQETLQQRIYITSRPEEPAASRAHTDLRLWVEDVVTGERAGRETTFNGRAN